MDARISTGVLARLASPELTDSKLREKSKIMMKKKRDDKK